MISEVRRVRFIISAFAAIKVEILTAILRDG